MRKPNKFFTSLLARRKFKLSSNILFIIICSLCFSYQSLQILTEYSLGKTVVNIKLTNPVQDTLPGVTICYDKFYSFQKLVEITPGYEKKWKEYQDHLEELAVLIREAKITMPEQLSKMLHFIDFYYKLTRTNRDYQYGYISMMNLSIPFFWLDNPDSPIILSEVQATTRMDDGDFIDYQDKMRIAYESLFFRDGSMQKCLTMFTWLNPGLRNLTVRGSLVVFYITFPLLQIPVNFETKVLFSLHSPNEMPGAKNFIELELGVGRYQVLYSKVITKLVPGRYEDKCHQYDLDYKHGNFNMQSDCMFNCLKKKHGVYDFEQVMRDSDVPIRKELLPSYIPNYIIWDPRIPLAECQEQCPDHCYKEYYLAQVSKMDKSEHWVNYLEVKLDKNHMPMVIVNHLPEMTFLSMLGNFGGLLGMWLGVSALGILNDTITRISHMLTKILFVKFDRNCFKFNHVNILPRKLSKILYYR